MVFPAVLEAVITSKQSVTCMLFMQFGQTLLRHGFPYRITRMFKFKKPVSDPRLRSTTNFVKACLWVKYADGVSQLGIVERRGYLILSHYDTQPVAMSEVVICFNKFLKNH